MLPSGFTQQVNWSIKIEYKFWPSSKASEMSSATTKAWKHQCTAVTTNNMQAVRNNTLRPNVFKAINGVFSTNWPHTVTITTSPSSNEEKGNDSLAEHQNSRVLLTISAHSPFHLFIIFTTSVLNNNLTVISHLLVDLSRGWASYQVLAALWMRYSRTNTSFTYLCHEVFPLQLQVHFLSPTC